MKQFKQKFRCVRSVQIRSFFWSVFSRIQSGYFVSLHIQSKYGKIRTRKNSVFGHFSRSLHLQKCLWLLFAFFCLLIQLRIALHIGFLLNNSLSGCCRCRIRLGYFWTYVLGYVNERSYRTSCWKGYSKLSPLTKSVK